MGCASSKKRTTSIEDLQAGGNAVNKEPLLNKNKNGQLPSNDNNAPIMRETAKQTQGAPPPSSSDAIHIPGAHKSFLAPDGIPFIDEDVDDDEERNGGFGDAPAVGKPDVNKNVVKEPLANQQQQPAPPAPTSVPPPVIVEEVKPPTVIIAGEQRTVVAPSAETSSEDATYRAALDVFSKDLDFEPVSAQNETHTSISVTTVETTVVTTSAESQESQPPVTDEQQLAAAAVKIQAGIRGYRDRQKVKAIRAAQQSPTDGPASALQHDDVNVSIVVADGEENYAAETTELYDEDADATAETEFQEQPVLAKDQEGEDDPSDRVKSEDLDEPEKERAAVKIQANYKGWKTRKEVGKVKK